MEDIGPADKAKQDSTTTVNKHDWTRQVLAILTTCFVFVYIILISVVNVQSKELANVALGFLLGTAATSVYGFYFGTSVGSEKKGEVIQDQLKH